jgi:deoxyribose-phosphate aldolase
MNLVNGAELAQVLEQTLAQPEATAADIKRLCAAARELKLHGVCVTSSRLELAAALLEDTDVKVTALVDFPLGAADSDAKRYETELAIDLGAQEVETILNIGRLKDGDHRYLIRELRDIAEAAEERPVKVVIEASRLTAEERKLACEVILDSGAKWVSTGTGLCAGATPEDVREIKIWVGDKFLVKAAGGVTSRAVALALREAGASRLATNDAAAVLKPEEH